MLDVIPRDKIVLMATQPIQPDAFRLDGLFRSDNLPTLRLFLEMWPDLKHLIELRTVQIRAIVDANVVQGELRWRLGSRENSQARSGLEEAIDAGVLVLIAPNFLRVEIEKYLPAIADSTGTVLSEVEREWQLFQAKLHFYQPSSRVADGPVADPKDLPYKHASDELSLPVYTRDAHLQKMGAPVVWVCIDTTCRDHARAMSVTLGFTVGSTYTVTIGVEALRAAVRGVKSLFDGFRRQPAWLQLAISGTVAAVVIHPKSRAKLLQLWNSACVTASQVKGPMLEGFVILMQQVAAAQSDAIQTHRQIQAVLPKAQKATAIVHARRICVVSADPVPIEEIVRRMRNEGYASRAKDPEAYLRRVLRKSGQFVELSPRMFALRT
jgi:hypothetical protein